MSRSGADPGGRGRFALVVALSAVAVWALWRSLELVAAREALGGLLAWLASMATLRAAVALDRPPAGAGAGAPAPGPTGPADGDDGHSASASEEGTAQ